MSSWNKIVTALVLSLLAVLAVVTISVDREPSFTARSTPILAAVQKRDFRIGLQLIGVIDAAKSHMISSELEGTSGTIISLIDDGTWVKKGDVLVRFDATPFQKEVGKLEVEVKSFQAAVQAAEQVVAFEANQVQREEANAEYRYSVATLELKRLQEGDGPLELAQLEEERQKVLIELKRYESFYQNLQELQEKGFDNPSEISTTQEQLKSHRKKLKTATLRFESYRDHVLPVLIESAKQKQQNSLLILQQTRQGGKHKVAKTRAALLQVKGILESKKVSLEKARIALAKTVIRAPFGGIIIHYRTFRNGQKRKPREGDTVFMNQPILYLPDISKMIVNTKVREVDLHKAELGQNGLISVDAYPDVQLSGQLSFIGALATSEESKEIREKYFQVTFKINEKDKRLRPGMTCRISVNTEEVQAEKSIPIQAVFYEDQESVCFVQRKDGSFDKTKVSVGRQNEEFVEILEGLEQGDQVSLSRVGN